MRLPRELDPTEIRVLGCLLEKQRTTPDAYPLSLNAITAACNQKSNRHPVMKMTESEVDEVLSRLRNEVMVWPEEGARIRKWTHNLDHKWGLDPPAMAIMTVLMLRGPQTAGELRGRTERMYAFSSVVEVEAALVGLTEGDEPLVVHLARQPGQKEARWMHLVAGQPDLPTTPVASPVSGPTMPGFNERITELEKRVARLESTLAIDDEA
jgi:uncharacterized protein YceH (UPF0502 family)